MWIIMMIRAGEKCSRMMLSGTGIADVWFGSNRVHIGEDTFINQGCMFNTNAPITIGARCAIGMRCTFVTSTHEVGTPDRRAGVATSAPITVGDGCWIGANVTVLPGVTIGDGCVVAAGAVVTRDCEPNSLYGGVPARKLRELALDTIAR